MSLFSSNEEHFCTPFALHNDFNPYKIGLRGVKRLEPESEYGNVEYKLRLTDPTPERIERLVTQLKWRIREGQGEAILFLGVKDDGIFVGLTSEEIRLSMRTLEQMSSKIGAKLTVVSETVVDPEPSDEHSADQLVNPKGKIIRNRLKYGRQQKEYSLCSRAAESSESSLKKTNLRNSRKQQVRKVLQVLVKRKTHDISEELRVAVLGPTDSGKSSLLGVLSHGEYDNGRGSARLNLFRHRHEIKSGHTSSISQELLGFDNQGNPLTYGTCLTTEELIESSSRIVTLIDLAGHQRYQGTTLFGLGSHSPDIVLLVVSVITPMTSVTNDHLSLALGMDRYLAIVINKIDIATKEDQESCYQELVESLQLLDPSVLPFRANSVNEAISMSNRSSTSQKNIPIFFTSCVTGVGLSSLYRYFYDTSPSLNSSDLCLAVNKSPELQVDNTFEVPGIGTVLSGLVTEGVVREGDEMSIGPDDAGRFSKVSIASLQRHKIPCNYARAGQKCTMAIIANENFKIRRGMVMKEMSNDINQMNSVCLEFEASVKLITSAKHRLSCGSQVSVFVGNVRQTCTVMTICKRSNDLWQVSLKFNKRPEYIKEGSRLIMRFALTKGIGLVSRVSPIGV